MARPKQSMDQRLLDARIAIDNSLESATIADAVAILGYDQARLQAARALYDEIIDLITVQKLEYGEQYEATAALQVAWDTADAAYRRTLKISRIAFAGNDKARNALRLDGSRKFSIGGWIEQTVIFYKAMLATPDFITIMTPYGYDVLKFEAEYALVQATINAKTTQGIERGEAQHATKMRDAKVDELDRWLADYKVIAEVALEESPQLLEQLGWVVPS